MYDYKYILVFMYSTRNSCQILMKLEFSRQIFEKYTSIKFHENSLNRSRVITAGRMHSHTDGQRSGQTNIRTDRQADKHEEAHSRFSKFCERA